MKVNFKSALYRVVILLLLTAIIAVLSFKILGKPTVSRLYSGNEIARFQPTLLHGSIQLAGETFLVVITCIIARKWLNVRL